MIENIKKEIKNTFYIDEYNMHFEVAEININTLFKILDKYDYPNYKELLIKNDSYSSEIQELSKYKKAWEELKKISQNDDCGEKTAHDFLWFLEQTMKELEKKHGIEVSNEN